MIIKNRAKQERSEYVRELSKKIGPWLWDRKFILETPIKRRARLLLVDLKRNKLLDYREGIVGPPAPPPLKHLSKDHGEAKKDFHKREEKHEIIYKEKTNQREERIKNIQDNEVYKDLAEKLKMDADDLKRVLSVALDSEWITWDIKTEQIDKNNKQQKYYLVVNIRPLGHRELYNTNWESFTRDYKYRFITAAWVLAPLIPIIIGSLHIYLKYESMDMAIERGLENEKIMEEMIEIDRETNILLRELIDKIGK